MNGSQLACSHQQKREHKMNEISIAIFCLIAGSLWAVMAYSVGFKEGERNGYRRGRAISRHISQHDKAAQ